MILYTANASGARSLQDNARVTNYLASKPNWPRTWLLEQVTDPEQMLTDVDLAAAVEQSSQMQLELTDIFCFNRDGRYSQRSRRWLYTRGYGTRMKRNYEMWVAHLRENPTHDNAGMLKMLPQELSNQSMTQLLDLIPGQSKVNRALAKDQLENNANTA